MAVALETLREQNKIESACELDSDLHFGDGTANILGNRNWVTVINVEAHSRSHYLREEEKTMKNCRADLIGISAGFDNHVEDWGGLLHNEDYEEIGRRVRSAAVRNGEGCFAILEGGYNHKMLGENVLAVMQGMSRG